MNRTQRNRAALIAAGGAGAILAFAAFNRARYMESLQGKVVFITGGSRGLGLLLAQEFASEGCRVAICARDPGELDQARTEIARDGADVLALVCDVTDREQVTRTIAEAIRHFGAIDILVNNAGEIQVGPLESMALEDFEHAMQTMFWGTVYPTMELLPHLLERNSGRIVNITSIGGKIAVPHLLPYTCAKFAAVGFSEGLRAELAKTKVKVVTIAPGLMRTGSHENAYFKGDQAKETVWFSLGATMPGISMSASRAARQIVTAARRGQAERILSAPANIAARMHGLFPGITSDILGLVNSLILPSGQSRGRKRGRETGVLDQPWMKVVTILGRLAAQRLQHPPEPRHELVS